MFYLIQKVPFDFIFCFVVTVVCDFVMVRT